MEQNIADNKSKENKKKNLSIKKEIRTYNTRQLSSFMNRITRPIFQQRSPKASQIIADWPEIIGPHYGSRSLPQKLSSGTLTIACNNPTATELQYISQRLIEKINIYCGQEVVKKLRFTYKKDIISSSPIVVKEEIIPIYIENFTPGSLQEALARLGGLILSRKKGKF